MLYYIKQITQKVLVVYLSIYLTFIPLTAYSAQLQTDGTTNTILDTSRNGVPIINIANPNTGGLSHNKFIHYNVDKKGIILNNSNQTNINTKLSGIIFGNKNLNNQATVILNEVSSTNRSQLNGWSEIAGGRADLIIANPNGLTINGAGFINTGNVTLTTGKPNFNNKQLNGFTIAPNSNMLIQGDGLNTNNQDSASIYTHYLKLNAKINAKKLSIKLGNNIIDANGNITSSINSNIDNQTNNLLLDSSALGGMYVGSISIVGTDKGLGVNLHHQRY